MKSKIKRLTLFVVLFLLLLLCISIKFYIKRNAKIINRIDCWETSELRVQKMSSINVDEIEYIFEGLYHPAHLAEMFVETLQSIGITDPDSISISKKNDRVIVVNVMNNNTEYVVVLSSSTGFINTIYEGSIDGKAIYYHTDD